MSARRVPSSSPQTSPDVVSSARLPFLPLSNLIPMQKSSPPPNDMIDHGPSAPFTQFPTSARISPSPESHPVSPMSPHHLAHKVADSNLSTPRCPPLSVTRIPLRSAIPHLPPRHTPLPLSKLYVHLFRQPFHLHHPTALYIPQASSQSIKNASSINVPDTSSHDVSVLSSLSGTPHSSPICQIPGHAPPPLSLTVIVRLRPVQPNLTHTYLTQVPQPSSVSPPEMRIPSPVLTPHTPPGGPLQKRVSHLLPLPASPSYR